MMNLKERKIYNKVIYDRLLKKYKAAEKNLKNNPDKCGGEKYIKGFMSGLLAAMAQLDDLYSIAN